MISLGDEGAPRGLHLSAVKHVGTLANSASDPRMYKTNPNDEFAVKTGVDRRRNTTRFPDK
jgi:hypothetical protein